MYTLHMKATCMMHQSTLRFISICHCEAASIQTISSWLLPLQSYLKPHTGLSS